MEGISWGSWLSKGLILIVVGVVIWSALRWFDTGVNAQSMQNGDELNAVYETIRAREDTVGGSWLRTLNPQMKDVQGDLLWSNNLQRGIMRFVNLPNPKLGQNYFLWIYDSRSGSSNPVLGAVMEQGSGKAGKFVELTASKEVAEPFKFVLTMGKAGQDTLQQEVEDSSIMLMVQP